MAVGLLVQSIKSRMHAEIPPQLSRPGSGKIPESVWDFVPDAISQMMSGKSSSRDNAQQFTLSWSHYVFLLGLGNEERSFYEHEASQQSWTLRELKRQYDSGLYERLALSRNPKSIDRLASHGQQVSAAQDLLKEPYVLEFLGLSEKASYSESDLESAIVSNVERFLLELGKGFLFEARQKRFTFDEDHFFIDLVLYNRLLHCYVLVDLKIGKLTHQDLGQMQMYVNYFDRHVKTQHENSTIGIILCIKHNQALVEITLPINANIHAQQRRTSTEIGRMDRPTQRFLTIKHTIRTTSKDYIAGILIVTAKHPRRSRCYCQRGIKQTVRLLAHGLLTRTRIYLYAACLSFCIFNR